MVHPATKPFLGAIARLQAQRRSETKVEYTADATHPGRSAVIITGSTRAGVQAEITRCMTAAENMGNSFCQFLNPSMQRDGSWLSRGEVIVSQVDERVAG